MKDMSGFDEFKSQHWECDFRTHPKTAPLCGVLIESRDHPDIEYALCNFSCMLPYASLAVFHSRANCETVKRIIGPDTNVQLRSLKEPFTWIDASYTVMDPAFWDLFMNHERVLIFMTDTGIRHNSILKFMHYDYIGAHWNHLPTGDPKVFQGNGAFTIINPKLVKEVVTRYACPDISKFMNGASDVYISHVIANYFPNAVLPSRATCAEFSTEGNDIDGTMGFHDTERYTPRAWRVYQLSDGPSRRLVNVTSADVDGRDVTALVRLGIGPNALRIFTETRFGPGKVLTVKTDLEEYSWDLEKFGNKEIRAI